MAKVDVIELIINRERYTYNVTVGKRGVFKCLIDFKIAQQIGINSTQEHTTLDALRKAILIPYHEYINASKREELMIWIDYRANGAYACNDAGERLFNQQSEFHYSASSYEPDRLGFQFGVFIRETSSTGNVVLYNAKKGAPSLYNSKEGNEFDPNKYYKTTLLYSVKGKQIPFSEEALNTLIEAREGIRMISNILYGVLRKEPKEIEAILLRRKILGQ